MVILANIMLKVNKKFHDIYTIIFSECPLQDETEINWYIGPELRPSGTNSGRQRYIKKGVSIILAE